MSTEVHGKDISGLGWMLTELTINADAALQRNPGSDALSAVSELAIVASILEDRRDFEVLVKNSGRPTERDHHEIMRRFRDYTGTRREIEALRERHTGADGIVRTPGTAGGGGLAILECIRASAERGLFFDFHVENHPRSMTVFRIASYPSESSDKGIDLVQQARRGEAEDRASQR